MPQQVFGAEAAVSMVNRALANTSPSHTVYVNQVAYVNATSEIAYAQALGAQYAVGKTAADLSALLLGNMGVDNEILQAALTDYIAFHGEANIGIIALQLGQILSGLEGDETFGAAAKAWNQEVTNAYQYSSSPNNNTPQTGDDGAGTTSLTRFTDVATGHEFTGYLDYNQFTGKDEQTLTDSDRLTGTDATDDLLFAQLGGVAAGATASARPTLNGIEIVSIDAKADDAELNLADANGVKTVINTHSNETSTLLFSNLKNLVDVVVRGTNGDTEVRFNGSVVAGTADALNLTVDGAGVPAKAADVTVAGIENLSIAATGNASVLGQVNSNSVQTLTITGDQNLTVGSKTAAGFNSAAIKTVDASAATGDLFLNIAASAGIDQTVTTGAGADVVVTGALGANDVFDLGEGNDRVVLNNGNSNVAAKLLGVEEVEARAAGTSLNLTNAADVKLLAIAETAAVAGFANVTGVKSGTTFVFEGERAVAAVNGNDAVFGGVKFNLANAAGASDVVDFKFNNGGVAMLENSNVTIGALNNSGSNLEILNLAFSDVGASNTVTVDNIDAAALKTLTVASDSKVVLDQVDDLKKLTSVDATGVKAGFTATFGDLAAAAAATIKLGGTGANTVSVGGANQADPSNATATLLTVDASAATGVQNITITGNADISVAAAADVTSTTVANAKAGVSVIGGSAGDTIAVTSTALSVNLISAGAGADTITLTGSAGVDVLRFAVGDASNSLRDTVTGFEVGTDKIDLSAFGFDTALQTAVNGGAMNGTAGEFNNNAVVAQNNTLYVDVNGDNKLDANDLVINIVGTDVTLGDILWS